MSAETVIAITDLRQSYGAKTAVNGLSLAVRRGEVFGVLGLTEPDEGPTARAAV